MKVLICGDRNWSDKALIKSRLQSFALQHDNVTVIHGAASGADNLAGEAAKELGMEVKEFPADWKTYGRSAGPIRNRQMLRQGEPDFVWAFHDNLRESKGTKDMVKVAGQLGYKVTLFCHEWARQNAGYLL
jgi:hypothetical protein